MSGTLSSSDSYFIICLDLLNLFKWILAYSQVESQDSMARIPTMVWERLFRDCLE